MILSLKLPNYDRYEHDLTLVNISHTHTIFHLIKIL